MIHGSKNDSAPGRLIPRISNGSVLKKNYFDITKNKPTSKQDRTHLFWEGKDKFLVRSFETVRIITMETESLKPLMVFYTC